ncbi:MAG: hypothetical protein JKY14_05395 [Paraglaciecola sp.]|nr:hypothetical protein [Paraglaciecola sp.]
MFSKSILLFTIIFISTNTLNVHAENLSTRFRDLYFETHKGLPRLGEQNTFGIVIPGESVNKSKLRAQKNKEQVKNLSIQIEKHNYSISLLKRLNFISRYAKCFKNMNKYEAITEACAGFVIDHANQGAFWKKYIETIAYALKPQHHAAEFCHNVLPCGARGIDNIRVKNENGRTLPLDEFERRDFVSDFMKNEYQAFEKYIKNESFHKEAYFVNKVQIGEYDFDKSQFHLRLRAPGSLASQNSFWQIPSNTMNSRQMPSQAIYTPTLAFENSMQAKALSGYVQFNINLAMSSNKARDLIKNNRTLFAVTRIAFVEPKFNYNNELLQQLANQIHYYHYAENKVEFYKDEKLTQKVFEVPLILNPKIMKEGSKQQKSERYSIDKNSCMFEYSTLGLLRLKEGNLLESDMKSIAYSVPANEKQFWIRHKSRVKQANQPMVSGSSAKAQKQLKINKKRAEDFARLSSFSWQDIEALSGEQQQAFYDFLAGKYLKNNELLWPSVLPSVPWGMNLATIFRKGYFSDDPKDKYVEADLKTRQLIMEFGRDLANSQNLQDFTLVYRIHSVHYDENENAIIVNHGKNPFARQLVLDIRNEKGKEFDGKAQKIIKRAKGKALYVLRSSTQNIGNVIPNSQYSNCSINKKNKSQNCISQSSGYAQINFLNAYLALDKEIGEIKISMLGQKGKKVASTHGPDAWRIVVELVNSDMDVTQYDVPDKKYKIPKGEVVTLFATVKRLVVLDPNGKIIWAKRADELKTPAIVVEKPIVAVKTAPIVKSAKDIANKQRERVEQLKIKEAKQEKTRQEQQAKHKKQQKILQCKAQNKQNMRPFQKCESLRSNLAEYEITLADAKANGCEENDEQVLDDMSEYKECNFGDVDMSQLTVKMQQCIAVKCGGSATTIDEIAEYQACVGGVGKFIQIQMQKVMSAKMGITARKRKPVNICKNLEKDIKRANKRLKKYQCNINIEPPIMVDCAIP